MADETPKKKKTIPLPAKKDEPATSAPAAKQETIEEKIARLEKEAKLAQLEKEAANRAKPPITTRTKEAISSGVEKTTGAVKKATSFVKEKTGIGVPPKISPVTGRPEVSPSLFEKGVTGLADIASVLANKAKTAITATSAEERLQAQMTPEEILAKKMADARRASQVKAQIAEQARQERLNAVSPSLDVGPDKQVVVSRTRGKEGIVPANLDKKATIVPLDERVDAIKAKIERYVMGESPLLNAKNVDKATVSQGALEGAKLKLRTMVGGDATAEDFIVKALNRSKQFTPDEVARVARQLVQDPSLRKTLEESKLFDAYERLNNRLSGGAPKPIDGGTSKFTTIQDDYGNEVKVTPEGRTSWAKGAEEPSLATRLERFKGQRADTARAAELARQAEAEAIRNSVAPYGGRSPSVATGPQAQLELRNEIETRRRIIAAQRAEAEAARQATRARIEGANNQAEQAFLNRQNAWNQLVEQHKGYDTWDLRTPAELYAASNPVTTPTPSGVTRMDALRQIASQNPKSAEEYAYLKWLHSRAPLNGVSTAGGAPVRGIVAESAPVRFLNFGRLPSVSGLGAAAGVVGGITAPFQIYDQIKSANSSDPYEANYGASDPLALRGLYDLILDPTVGGMSWENAKRNYTKKANDPRVIEKSPLTSSIGQAARGNPAYLKALVNHLAYYGNSPYGWGLFADEQPMNLNEAR